MLFLVCVSAALGAQQTVKTVSRSGHAAALRYLEGRLQRYERETWYWQRLTGSPRTETAGRTLAGMAVGDLERTIRVWQQRDLKAHRLAQHPPHRVVQEVLAVVVCHVNAVAIKLRHVPDRSPIRGDILGDPGQPDGTRGGGFLVDDQRAADLDDDAPGGGKRRDHAATFCLASWIMFCSARKTSGTP